MKAPNGEIAYISGNSLNFFRYFWSLGYPSRRIYEQPEQMMRLGDFQKVSDGYLMFFTIQNGSMVYQKIDGDLNPQGTK